MFLSRSTWQLLVKTNAFHCKYSRIDYMNRVLRKKHNKLKTFFQDRLSHTGSRTLFLRWSYSQCFTFRYLQPMPRQKHLLVSACYRLHQADRRLLAWSGVARYWNLREMESFIPPQGVGRLLENCISVFFFILSKAASSP